jgi:hypothetical protein
MSIWETSNVLLNGENIQLLKAVEIKDGDRLDLISNLIAPLNLWAALLNRYAPIPRKLSSHIF